MLADEPTGNLDRETSALIIELLHDLARSENTAILAVTHDPEMASAADVTFQLSDGRLVDAGAFDIAAASTGAAYEHWLETRSDGDLNAFVSTLSAMIAAAPAGRRLSAAKIRRRYAEAVGHQGFESAMAPLESVDLFEDVE